jgi:uncharacterized protein YPO0396
MLKPSKELVEQLGDQVTSELVGWFNTMYASQKGDLRDMNEQNFARFDAKLEQRDVELHAKLDAKIDQVGAGLDAKIDRVGARLDAKIDRVDAKIDRVAAELNAKIDKTAAELKEVLERRLGEHTRWSYLTWAVQAAMIIGLYFK